MEVPHKVSVSPLLLGVLSVACTMAGGYLKDRVAIAGDASTMGARVQANEQRIADLRTSVQDLQKGTITREEYSAFTRNLDNRLEEMRQDLRDIKSELVPAAPRRR